MNSPLIPSLCWNMTPSFSNPERNAMTPLEQKLQQLNLKAMSRQAEAAIADAAARNLSVSAIHVQLQRQSSASALADGVPVVCGVPVAGPRHAARLPAL